MKENLDALLDEVAQGAHIAITRSGREVARLVPTEGPRISRQEFLRRAAARKARQPRQTSRAEDLVREDRDAPIATADRRLREAAASVGVALWEA